MEINKNKIIGFTLILLIPFIIDFFDKNSRPYNTKNTPKTTILEEKEKVIIDNKFDITINIKNIKNSNGFINIAMFNNPDNFPSNYRHAIFSTTEKIYNKQNYSFTIKDIDPGKYSIALYMDNNKNKILDTGIFGIPLEQYGFSNNPKIQFKAPSFEETSFTLNENIFLSIKLN